jgi:hypothetical protein
VDQPQITGGIAMINYKAAARQKEIEELEYLLETYLDNEVNFVEETTKFYIFKCEDEIYKVTWSSVEGQWICFYNKKRYF